MKIKAISLAILCASSFVNATSITIVNNSDHTTHGAFQSSIMDGIAADSINQPISSGSNHVYTESDPFFSAGSVGITNDDIIPQVGIFDTYTNQYVICAGDANFNSNMIFEYDGRSCLAAHTEAPEVIIPELSLIAELPGYPTDRNENTIVGYELNNNFTWITYSYDIESDTYEYLVDINEDPGNQWFFPKINKHGEIANGTCDNIDCHFVIWDSEGNKRKIHDVTYAIDTFLKANNLTHPLTKILVHSFSDSGHLTGQAVLPAPDANSNNLNISWTWSDDTGAVLFTDAVDDSDMSGMINIFTNTQTVSNEGISYGSIAKQENGHIFHRIASWDENGQLEIVLNDPIENPYDYNVAIGSNNHGILVGALNDAPVLIKNGEATEIKVGEGYGVHEAKDITDTGFITLSGLFDVSRMSTRDDWVSYPSMITPDNKHVLLAYGITDGSAQPQAVISDDGKVFAASYDVGIWDIKHGLFEVKY